MPTYGYRCTECGNEFERFQKISDPALTECESCGGTVKKRIYPVGIQFKGAGFYVNDYSKRSSDGGTSAASGSASSSESGSSASDTTASKPAETAASAPTEGSKPAATPAPTAGSAVS